MSHFHRRPSGRAALDVVAPAGTWIRLCVAVVCACLIAALGAAPAAALVWSDNDFVGADPADLTPPFNSRRNQGTGGEGSVSITDAPWGGSAEAFELLLPAPAPKAGPDDTARIFMYPGDRNDLIQFREGDHAWLGVGVYIPPAWDLTQIQSRSADHFVTLWGFRHGDEHGPLNGMVLSTSGSTGSWRTAPVRTSGTRTLPRSRGPTGSVSTKAVE